MKEVKSNTEKQNKIKNPTALVSMFPLFVVIPCLISP